MVYGKSADRARKAILRALERMGYADPGGIRVVGPVYPSDGFRWQHVIGFGHLFVPNDATKVRVNKDQVLTYRDRYGMWHRKPLHKHPEFNVNNKALNELKNKK